MRRRSLQRAVTNSKITFSVAVIIAILGWVAAYIFVPDLSKVNETYPLRGFVQSYIAFPEWACRLLSLAVYMLMCFFMIGLNNTYGIIRAKASIHTSFLIWFVTAIPVLHLFRFGDIATLFFIISFYFLFRTYQNSRPVGLIFHSFVFAGIATLILPQMIFIIPVLWLGASLFNAFSFRGFCASLLGWSLPYCFLFAYAYIVDNIDIFYQPFIELTTFQPLRFDSYSLELLVGFCFFFILFIVSTIHSFMKSYKDKIRTRLYLRFFIILNIFIFIYVIFQPVHAIDFLPLLFVGISMLVAHLFVLTKSKASNLFFICVILGLILLFCFNLWMLL